MGEKQNLQEIKVKRTIAKDKIIISSIVGSMVVIALVVFGIFLYNTNYKAVATFNGGKLEVADFNIYYKTFSPLLAMYGYDDEMIRDEIANKAVLDKIILSLAEKNGITLKEEDLAEVDKLMSDEKQTEYIKSLGINPAQMEDLYRSDYLIAAYTDYMKGLITEEEMRKYITEEYGKDQDLRGYTTKHVLISTLDKEKKPLPAEDKTAKYAEAVEVINRLNKGEKIDDLAKELSEDTVSGANGGLIEMYMNNKLVKEYSDAVLKLEVGKYTTTPVETEYGYHIIYLEAYDETGLLKSNEEKEVIVSDKVNGFIKEYNVEIDIDAVNKAILDETGKDLSKKEEVDIY